MMKRYSNQIQTMRRYPKAASCRAIDGVTGESPRQFNPANRQRWYCSLIFWTHRAIIYTGCLLIAATFYMPASAQETPANTGGALLVPLSYAYQLPGADLSDRFGGNFSLGGGLEYLTAKQHWFFGLQGQFLFGSTVKPDVLAELRTPEGYIYGNNKSVADIQLRERGFYAGAHIGKLVPLSAANPRSALRLSFGAGLLQHKIRIQDDPVASVPQLEGEYKSGYDRLSNGLSLKQFIGYQLLGEEGRINFYAGLEFIQGFTRSRRDFQFDLRSAPEEERFDLLFGLRVGWILPFYLRKAEEVYY